MNFIFTNKVFLSLLLIIILGGFSFLLYQNYNLFKDNNNLKITVSSLEQNLVSTTQSLTDTKIELQLMSEAKISLENDLTREQGKIMAIMQQLNTLSGTVYTLDKLQKTDSELLKKYSKVYFLSENYVPYPLIMINESLTFDSASSEKWIHASVWPFLDNLLRDAANNGNQLLIVSAYRTFATQAELKSSYKVIYGAGTANQFSADQGYSEHQLGTTIDLTTKELGAAMSSFDKDKAYLWLTENAHRYGFILSYPKGNSYYRFEPWHWRFVGIKLAHKLHLEQKNFYDLTQREIDEYLVSLFDPQ